MNMKSKPELLEIVNLLSTSYYYQPVYVKGAEDLIFLEGSDNQEFQLIALTTIDFTNVLDKEKTLEKVKMVQNKITSKEGAKTLIISFHPKRCSTVDRSIYIHHVTNDYIPDALSDEFPKLETLEVFDDFMELIKEEEKDIKEQQKKGKKIEDSGMFSTLLKKNEAKNKLEPNTPSTKILKSSLKQNVVTKFLLFACLFAALAMQFLVVAPAGSSTVTTIIAFGGAYNPFVYGFDGVWRLFTYFFISNSIFSFAFLAIAFYFFSRMSESFYGALRYLIIFFLGSIISGLVATQLFPEVVFYSLGIPIWIMIGSTGTFVIARWRSIAISIKVKYFIYTFLVLIMFGLFGNLGSNIEAGLLSLLIGAVVGIGVQFKTVSFKDNWRKSINPLIAISSLLITAITLPLATPRKTPLQTPHLNQSVLVTYERYNLMSRTAREAFTDMNNGYFLVSNGKSSCLWNPDIRYTAKALPITSNEETALTNSKAAIDGAFATNDPLVFAAQEAEIDAILALFSATTFATLSQNLTNFKAAITDYKTNRTTEKMNVVNTTFNSISTHIKNLASTETLSIVNRRSLKVYNDIKNWSSIAYNSTTTNYGVDVDVVISNPNLINIQKFRSSLKNIDEKLKTNIAGVPTTFLALTSQQINALSYWCVNEVI